MQISSNESVEFKRSQRLFKNVTFENRLLFVQKRQMYQQLHMLQENISFSFTVLTDEPISAECTIAASDKKNPNRTELPVVFRPFSRKKNVGANGCYNSLVAFLSVHHTDD